MKRAICVILALAAVAGMFAACGKLEPEKDNPRVVVTEDPTKLRTIYGTASETSKSFIYEVINPYEKQEDGSDIIDSSYQIVTEKDTVEAALSEKGLLKMNEYGFIDITLYPDLTGGEWEFYINGKRSGKDITKVSITEGDVYSFKYIK